MKSLLLVLALLSVPVDQQTWQVTARAYSVVTVYAPGSTTTYLSSNVVTREGVTLWVARCPAGLCSTALLGNCPKITRTLIDDSPTHPATYVGTSCIDPRAAQCLRQSGRLLPEVLLDAVERGGGCQY